MQRAKMGSAGGVYTGRATWFMPVTFLMVLLVIIFALLQATSDPQSTGQATIHVAQYSHATVAPMRDGSTLRLTSNATGPLTASIDHGNILAGLSVHNMRSDEMFTVAYVLAAAVGCAALGVLVNMCYYHGRAQAGVSVITITHIVVEIMSPASLLALMVLGMTATVSEDTGEPIANHETVTIVAYVLGGLQGLLLIVLVGVAVVQGYRANRLSLSAVVRDLSDESATQLIPAKQAALADLVSAQSRAAREARTAHSQAVGAILQTASLARSAGLHLVVALSTIVFASINATHHTQISGYVNSKIVAFVEQLSWRGLPPLTGFGDGAVLTVYNAYTSHAPFLAAATTHYKMILAIFILAALVFVANVVGLVTVLAVTIGRHGNLSQLKVAGGRILYFPLLSVVGQIVRVLAAWTPAMVFSALLLLLSYNFMRPAQSLDELSGVRTGLYVLMIIAIAGGGCSMYGAGSDNTGAYGGMDEERDADADADANNNTTSPRRVLATAESTA